MVVALAGRRVDAEGAEPPRFPLDQIDRVRGELRALFEDRAARALVSSAACGADLLAIEVADALGIPFRIVLPFDRERFRRTSVTDRPGDWGPVFDRLVRAAQATGNLVVLDEGESDTAYARANEAILNEAARMALEARDAPLAVVVWDKESRGAADLTGHFLERAKERRWATREIDTKSE